MIRRGFWLAAGAAGGIMGYRRVASFGRRVSGRLDAGRARAVRRGWVRQTIRFTRHARDFTRSGRDFTRDVREGMDLYNARHPDREGPTLGASTGTDETDEKDVR